ncbi:Hypothetical_protein [Hexamita inflata]|uniref:Hypothetical_protein n=1 Tax=Hexamita inflata TaxID=28002 RepID=A0AA86TXK2_9EUKA|nr:Hypothetical protein HINF_LOCUS18452 [Hexamita inflata]
MLAKRQINQQQLPIYLKQIPKQLIKSGLSFNSVTDKTQELLQMNACEQLIDQILHIRSDLYSQVNRLNKIYEFLEYNCSSIQKIHKNNNAIKDYIRYLKSK